MKKILLIIPLLFIFSGCTLKYKVVIDKDLKTSETLEMLIEKSSIDEMILKYGDNYVDEKLEESREYFEKENYSFDYKNNENIYFSSKKENNAFSLNKRIMESRYNYYDFTCNQQYCLLYATAYNDIIAGDGGVYDLELSIQVPYKVISNNADKVDKINNIYTWYSTKKNDNSDIKLIFYKDGNDVVKRNKILYFITIGIFAIIGLLILYFAVKFLKRIKDGGKPM